ncbi:hypothetical protein Salat_0210800 [Sesamum alatum]|uniref:Uncharacterized protein n=1 Tax=Sesamum alatum TaxID=300844 RepID=A0AAE1YYT5_9LAMI|nr:hypothetical protein Salat_0210800 [Sesamum alatum]
MVFRFGKHEMCPTLEEVHRILEISRNVLFSRSPSVSRPQAALDVQGLAQALHTLPPPDLRHQFWVAPPSPILYDAFSFHPRNLPTKKPLMHFLSSSITELGSSKEEERGFG